MKRHVSIIPSFLVPVVLALLISISGCVKKECEMKEDCPDKACFAKECVTNACSYSQIAPCCGDGKCEAGEDHKTCTVDCRKSGFLERSEVWGGTILITGDINLDPNKNVTITILPGTKVIFTAHKDDYRFGRAKYDAFGEKKGDPTITQEYSDNHVELSAKIIAQGTPDKRIMFTSDGENPTHYDYEHIALFDGSIFNYTITEYARSGVNPTGNNVVIANSIIRHVLWGCVGANTFTPLIVNNEIYDCGHEGVDVQPGGNPTIIGNTISRSAVGIIVITGGNATIKNNKLIENGLTISSEKGVVCDTCVIENNEIVHLKEGERLEWYVDGKLVYEAGATGQK